jgi:alcohol dehydrogenase class IV
MTPIPPHGSYLFLPIDKVIYGPGTVSQLTDEVERLDAQKVFVASTSSIAEKTDLLQRVENLLGKRFVGSFSKIRQHTPSGAVTVLSKRLEDTEADMVVSLGGGSVIDATKAAVLAAARNTDHFLPHIALPTTLSASEFSPLFGVTDDATKIKAGGSNPFVTPRVAILDAELTVHTPAWLWRSSGVRALDHAVETVYAPDHGPATDAPALEAIRLLFEFLPASADAENLYARQQCQLAAWLSFFGVANITLGLSHLLGRQIGPRYDVPHGHTSAVLLPKVMEAILPTTMDQQALIACAAGVATRASDVQEAAGRASPAIFDFVASMELPQRLRDLGVAESDLDELSGGRPEVLRVLQAAW